AYWNRGAYLGCGPAAHSFRPCDQRFWNPADLDEYIVKGEEARSFELLEAGEVLCEELILGLRLAGGVGPEPIGEIKGRQFGETLRMLEQEGLGGFTDRGGFALTEHGWLVYDSVLECLIEESGVMLDKAVLNCHYH
ncbi:MAG: hypothetical protein U9P14_02695, partial [Gemmatimonadota bacterium]|nr:hypothetical protein [Gemmatimonadota bacterium]